MKDYKMLQANDDTDKHYNNYDFIETVNKTRCEYCGEKKDIQNTAVGYSCKTCFKEITKRDLESENDF